MIQLWYNLDEVTHFQPNVELALNKALSKWGYDNIAEIVHNPKIPNSTTIPDCAIRLKSSGRFVFIVEVKRTQRDVDSQRYQNQARAYVTDFGSYWESGYPKYFCITNIEKLVLFADRQGYPLVNCLLKNNPKQHTLFNPANHDASLSINELQATFENILPNIFNRVVPDWDNNWKLIIECFYNNYVALKSSLNYPESISKELSLYELFRLLAYGYFKDFYLQMKNPNAAYFRSYPVHTTTLEQFIKSLVNNYNRILQIDFKQIFSNHPNQVQRLFPENLSHNHLQYFSDLIKCLTKNGPNAIAENPSPSHFFNLMTSAIYEKEELHEKGMVMSDAELSNLLAALCIDSEAAKILDPGCGDGALLDAAYDQINLLAIANNRLMPHNQILSQIDGIEKDSFLAQLSTFRLLSKNLTQIDNQTNANILVGDVFQNPNPNQYDVVLMNPPFLRNDNPNMVRNKGLMINAIKSQGLYCFVSEASQPNLYFYFTNYLWHYLGNNGKAGLILMTKFLNNADGIYLKQFILDKVETIISYPRKYFKGFDVTTIIVILKKGNNSSNVSFLRVTEESLLLDSDKIKAILYSGTEAVTPSHRLTIVPRNILNASKNWKEYLLDQKMERFSAASFLVEIEHHFDKIKRGGAENNGGSKLVFPNWDSTTNQYFGKGRKPKENIIDIPKSLNHFIKYGIKNNDTRRNYILQLTDLAYDVAFHFPALADKLTHNLLPINLAVNADLNTFYTACSIDFGTQKWEKIINNSVHHTGNPKIIIPRADRTKHCVYYNPNSQKMTLSTNFFYCNDLKNANENLTEEEQYKFITAFLLSAFGQIQFELNANNQEGLRKLEGFQIKRFKIPDLCQFIQTEIQSVLTALDSLDAQNVEFSGDEGINTPRRNLDLAIGLLFFSRDSLGFLSADLMVDYFELFLADLVEDRRI